MPSTLEQMHQTQTVYDQEGHRARLSSAISKASTDRLTELVREVKATNTLEVGMAMGASTLAILEGLNEGHHVAIDPYQTASHEYGWKGIGLEMVRRSGLKDKFTLIEETNYVALPRILSEGKTFDLIFIDGFHAFDTAFIDYFYSDLLLRDGGYLVFDDWGIPCVRHVMNFLETHKNYRRLRATWNELNVLNKLKKFWHQKDVAYWGSIAPYQKLSSTSVTDRFSYCSFYPAHKSHRIWAWLRRHQKISPQAPMFTPQHEFFIHSWDEELKASQNAR